MRALALLFFFAVHASAQTGGATLLVDARDQTGAPLPGVMISIKSDDTGLERAGATTDDGTVWLVRMPAPLRRTTG